MEIINKSVMPTSQNGGITKVVVRVQSGQSGLRVERVRKREQELCQHTSIFIFTLSRAHTRTTHTQRGIKVASMHAFYLLSFSLLHY